ncbi:hypothetical protein Ciccas_000822 [Cichlidogyrus casuarinus]|uniref:Uncharacterized protein n=1 Tax=Cichlidogyrus casuarinus TaxID=1844966 RepID=A0ABD2QM32_9PLAT
MPYLQHSGVLDQETSIPVQMLNEHIRNLCADNSLLMAQEYASIDPGQQFTWEHSMLEVNKNKNRYANVVAYDHSRVVLQRLDGIPGSDYINANFVDGYKKPNAYIATQGPMLETISDFWRMVWEQGVSILVMMTRLEERSRIKCDYYWPTRGPETYADGSLTVTPVDTVELAYYTIRTFTISLRNPDPLMGTTSQQHATSRELKQFQFTGWPDHGVPDYPIPLLLFQRRVRAAIDMQNSQAPSLLSENVNDSQASGCSQLTGGSGPPVVVHCSAGVGRTGAFIVLDIQLERIRCERTVDVYGCVRALRSQRNFMVQTEDQYVFVHSALMEAVDAGNTECPIRSFYAHVKSLSQIDIVSGLTGIALEYKVRFTTDIVFQFPLLTPACFVHFDPVKQ